MATRRDAPETAPGPARWTESALRLTDVTIYALVSLVLIASALVLLGHAAYTLVSTVQDGVVDAVHKTLDSLLIVFILVELLGAIRATVRERRLIAEPFLLVGIIASIKEIVVVASGAEKVLGEDPSKFRHEMVEIAILGVIVVGLAFATLLLRRKEREPQE